jgi:hypothetical protein
LNELRRLEETGHIVTLDASRAAMAIRAVDFYAQGESMLRLAASVRNVAVLVGGLLVIYWATEGWIIQKIAGIASGAGQ